MNKQLISFVVNGEQRDIAVVPNRSLLDTLRHEVGMTGTKKRCDVEEGGACTVIVNGKPINACLVLAPGAEGAEITTIVGLQTADGTPHRLQEAFMQCGAVQCGFCTPGLLIQAKA